MKYQGECRLLNVEFLELKGVLVQSIASLQDREVLFKYALDEYTTARRNYVVRAYIDALTRGGAGGTPKPIEMLSHDPLRYISDMLAWIHQAMATERELLQALLKLCNSDVLKENSISIQSQISEALCRPFKVRKMIFFDHMFCFSSKYRNFFIGYPELITLYFK
ncbi:unnamed protein product [Brugia timori]|uniref:Conserved oligomeric Golgi complex subunit 6 n=1 Tax=Brugia timori TaxID=42155 RepID=A0A0R3Q900_9BILA|nr:unnamed protein product [Brugia timori]